MGRLGSGTRVSASFQIVALTAGGDVLGEEGNCPGGGLSGGICPRREMIEGGNVLHSMRHPRGRAASRLSPV